MTDLTSNSLPSLNDKEYFGPARTGRMFGPDGLRYGHEWARDDFDIYADNYLLTKLSTSSTVKSALDIGCGTGRRIIDLIELNLFDRLYASDLAIRDLFQRVACTATQHRPTLQFVQQNVVDLSADDFPETTFDYINCRNVVHFLSPADFRKTLQNIVSLAAENALVTLSFDAPYSGFYKTDVCEDIPNFYALYRSSRHKAAHATYGGCEVETLMNKMGFKILPIDLDYETDNVRECEYRIAALAPGPEKPRIAQAHTNAL